MTGTTRTFDRSRLRLGIVIAVICGALVLLLFQVGKATTFYLNADEAVAKRVELGDKRIRLQGVVVPGSIKDVGADVEFTVEYHCVTVPVHHEGTRPTTLFQNGIPVVLGGSFEKGTAKRFDSDQIIIKHTQEYRTKASEKAEATEKERCSR